MAFPDALSSVVDAPTGTETLGGSTPSHSAHHQSLADAINETQAALGVGVTGAWPTVADRIAAAEEGAGTGGGGGYRGVWLAGASYSAGDLVLSGGSLWGAVSDSTGSEPAEGRVYALAGTDSTQAEIALDNAGGMVYTPAEVMTPFELNAATLLGGFQFGFLGSAWGVGHTFSVGIGVAAPAGSQPPTLLTAATTNTTATAQGTANNVHWCRFLFDAPVQADAGVTYWLWIRDEEASSFNSNQLGMDSTPTYTGSMQAPDTATSYIRNEGGAWYGQPAGRRLVLGVVSASTVDWDRLA